MLAPGVNGLEILKKSLLKCSDFFSNRRETVKLHHINMSVVITQ